MRFEAGFCLRPPFPKTCLADTPFLVGQSLYSICRTSVLVRKQTGQQKAKIATHGYVAYARLSSALCFQRMGCTSHAGGHASTIGYSGRCLSTSDAWVWESSVYDGCNLCTVLQSFGWRVEGQDIYSTSCCSCAVCYGCRLHGRPHGSPRRVYLTFDHQTQIHCSFPSNG